MSLTKQNTQVSESKHLSLQLDCLIDLAVTLGEQNDYREALRLVTQKAASLTGAEISLIMMINPKTKQTVKTIYAEGEDDDESDFHYFHVNLSGWVIKNNCGFISQNLSTDERFHKQLFSKSQLKSAICVPFKVEGTVIGTLLLMNTSHKAVFTAEDLAFMERFAAITSPFLRNTQQIQKYFSPALPKESLLKKYQAFGLLGKSSKFIELLNSIEAAARCDIRVMLEGESGTGKELIARAIHRLSSRSSGPFIAIDCGAIPDNLMESELFGHVKGAFTGATNDRKGMIEAAHGGTFFMDEITNLSIEMQAKLLRVLQEGEIRPIGSTMPRKVDVRIISASSKKLSVLRNNREFREDLFYRLYVYPLHVPSLNDRHQDIPLLANYFLQKFAAKQQKRAEFFDGSMLRYMQHRKWSGNIRELENFIERVLALSPPELTILDHTLLPAEYKTEFKKLTKANKNAIPVQKSLQESVDELEEKIIRQVLNDTQWNQSQTARILKVSEQTIRYKMQKLGIVKKD